MFLDFLRVALKIEERLLLAFVVILLVSDDGED